MVRVQGGWKGDAGFVDRPQQKRVSVKRGCSAQAAVSVRNPSRMSSALEQIRCLINMHCE